MNNHRSGFGILGMLAFLWACDPAVPGDPQNLPEAAVPQVYTVNYPLAWMADRLVTEAADVLLPVPPATDPAHWQPSAETILDYQAADVVIVNGAGYAGWVQFASLSPSRVVDASAGLTERLVVVGGPAHSHGPEGDHTHGEVASHTWLDPTLAAAQAVNVASALERITGPNTTALERLQADLATLDTTLAAAFESLPGTGVLYSHPIYQYLDVRYGLNGRSVNWEPDQDPGAEGFLQLEALLKERPASVMLWEDEPLPVTRARLAEMGVGSIVFHTGAGWPAARSPASPAGTHYLDLMRNNVRRLVEFEQPES